jgi:hypothetical protein
MKPTAEVKSLQECKDEIARKYGYENWQSVDFYQIDAMNETKAGEIDAEHFLLDEAAELYASQFRSSLPKEEPEVEKPELNDDQDDIEQEFQKVFLTFPQMLNPLYQKMKQLRNDKEIISNKIAKQIGEDTKAIMQSPLLQEEHREQDDNWRQGKLDAYRSLLGTYDSGLDEILQRKIEKLE